jgi:DNA-binding NarL/FixJ family response regulator
MRVMADCGRDDLPADLQRELLEYGVLLKALVEQLLERDRRAPSASAARPDPTAGPNDRLRLTEREAQILQLLVTGRTNRQIGAELRIRAGTVRTHLSKLYRKLGVTTRTQAAVRAVEFGLTSTASRCTSWPASTSGSPAASAVRRGWTRPTPGYAARRGG